MEENQQHVYELPVMFRSGLKPGMHVAYFVFILVLTAFGFLAYSLNTVKLILLGSLLWCLGLFLLFLWAYIGILRKGEVALTEEEVSVKTLFGHRSLSWADIGYIQSYYMNRNRMIGIVSREKLQKQKDTLLHTLADALGGIYSLTISLNTFPQADAELLYATLFTTMRRYHASEEAVPEGSGLRTPKERPATEHHRSTADALFRAFLIAVPAGLLNGLLIYLVHVQFLIIAAIGVFGILYEYNRHYDQDTARLGSRIVLGLACSIQFFIALLFSLILNNQAYIAEYNVWKTIVDCVLYITAHPVDALPYYIFAALFFLVGLSHGSNLTFLRKIRKPFLKKLGGFTVERDQKRLTLYLADYAAFKMSEEKILGMIEPNRCLVENEGDRLYALLISEETIQDCEIVNISEAGFEKTAAEEKSYYRLDLGGKAEPRPYGYPCELILDRAHRLEVIKLEIG